MAVLQSIGQAIAGSVINTRFQVSLPFDLSLANAIAKWELLDLDGFTWNAGDCGQVYSEQSQTNPQEQSVYADSVIALPTSLVLNAAGTKYQIRYTLFLEQQAPLYVFDQFSVLPQTEIRYGPSSTLELVASGMQPVVTLTLPEAIDTSTLACAVFINNVQVASATVSPQPVTTQNGYVYSATLPAPKANLAMINNVEPYVIQWTYADANGLPQTEIGRMWVVNTAILDVAREVQSYINRAYTDGGIAPGTTFGTIDVMEYLRIGRDQFNASDKPTNFTMTNARGGFRWFWLLYSSAAACRAQYLVEGMKAFNYSGQEVQLDVDRTQYWDSMAQNLEQQANDQIKNFKDNLMRYGQHSGDGSSVALGARAVGSIGVTLHGASPLRGAMYMGLPGMFGMGFGYLGFMGW